VGTIGEATVKFGVCCGPDRAAELAAFGFDFMEWSVASNIGTADDAAIDSLRKIAHDLPVQVEAWNVLLPGDLKVVGEEADHEHLVTYLESVLPHVRELGGEVVVFGSGRSRTVPDGYDRDQAIEEFEAACRIVADAAAANSLTIAFEPLRTGETNMINRVDEGYSLVRKIDKDAFQLLADHYHMLDNGEDEEVVVDVADRLVHAHIASRPRTVPLTDQEIAELTPFLSALKRANYDRRLSFEARWEDPNDLSRGLDLLKSAWAAA
jgi:sugar phosphate isomerase/epimerase